jgi:antitoxin component YwqK of YwqJK toxin-antitoxin module
LIENYEDGNQTGKETRFAYLKRKQIPCDTTNNSNVNPLDTCHEMVYQKVFQTSYYKNNELYGPFERKDSVGIITFKGNFIFGKKDGLWLESRVSEDIDDKKYYTFLRGNYTNGLETGNWDEFVTEDFIQTKYSYANGKLNGKTTNYNSYKKPSEEKYFEDGQLRKLDIYDSLGTNIIRGYEIFDETSNSLKCKKTEYYSDGKSTQVYTLIKENSEEINHNYFDLIFKISVGKKSDGSLGYTDGEFKLYNNNEKILIEGSIYKKNKIGVWKYYYYDVNVFKEQAFNNNLGDIETYYIATTGKLFSGKFIQNYENGKLKYEFKISGGLRDGKSKYYDENGNLTKTEKYEKGILQ